MNNGYLSQYFEAVAAKRLSAVEINLSASHQHEFNGSRELKGVLKTTERTKFQTKFLWIEEQNEALSDEGTVTWYDARENHPTRSEYRLYFSNNAVIEMAKPGDIMFIAKRTDNTLLIILVSSGSTIENQLFWLFGIDSLQNEFKLSEIAGSNDHQIDFAVRYILDEIEIEVEEPENDKIDNLLEEFNGHFPTTIIFSDFARKSFPDEFNVVDDPDRALLSFMNWEEMLFKRMERYIVASRLREGFADNEDGVDGFISFSLSVQNRRKSRAGYAFEDHLAYILNENKVLFSRKGYTENKSKPDFLFPGIDLYHKNEFPDEFLTMLGTKTSCKDRWRQVLSEAKRISPKHLLTLEPGISETQTDEMRDNNLQLILPRSIHETYTEKQQEWLIDVKQFIEMVYDRQRSAHAGLYLS